MQQPTVQTPPGPSPERQKVILYVENCADGTVGGSFLFMYDLATHLNREEFRPVAVFHEENVVAGWFRSIGVETYVFERPRPINLGALMGRSTSIQRALVSFLSPVQRVLNFLIQFVMIGIQRARFLRDKRIDLVDLNNSITRNHEWMLACRLSGVKCVTHEAGINDHYAFFARYFRRRIDGIICCSKAIFDNMIQKDMTHAVMPIIHSCIAPQRLRIREGPDEIKRRFGLDGAGPIIGVVGNLKGWKGQATVVRATGSLVRTWPSLRCLLVGNNTSDPEYYAHLLARAREAGVVDNVVFAGFQESPIDFLNVMDVVIHSSIQPEPFGMVNLEAMSLGKPVVATNIGGPLEIFEDGVSGILVPPDDADALAAAVSALLGDPHKIATIGAGALRRFEDKFSFERTVRRTQAVYRAVLNMPGDRSFN